MHEKGKGVEYEITVSFKQPRKRLFMNCHSIVLADSKYLKARMVGDLETMKRLMREECLRHVTEEEIREAMLDAWRSLYPQVCSGIKFRDASLIREREE